MPRSRKNTDLLAALVDRLADAVAAHLGGIGGTARTKRKPTLSRAGIERIRAAQKKRWAEYRKKAKKAISGRQK
jgi:hypothetical protein